MTTELSEFDAKAAESGNLATERFRDSGKTEALEVPTERVSLLANEVLAAVFETVRKHKVTYDEFNALKAWLIGVGEDGEWPLFLDVWVEHVIEEVSTEDREGNKGTIEGPYYVPGSPRLQTPATLPMRADEGGTPLLFQGQVRAVDGTPLPGAGGNLARRRQRFLLPVRPGPAGVEPPRHRRGRWAGQLRAEHRAARPLPDPH